MDSKRIIHIGVLAATIVVVFLAANPTPVIAEFAVTLDEATRTITGMDESVHAGPDGFLGDMLTSLRATARAITIGQLVIITEGMRELGLVN